MSSSKIVVQVYAAGVTRDGKKYLQGLVGDSDLISYSISADGKESFSMYPGVYSRKEGTIYDEFKRLVSGPFFMPYDAINRGGETANFL